MSRHLLSMIVAVGWSMLLLQTMADGSEQQPKYDKPLRTENFFYSQGQKYRFTYSSHTITTLAAATDQAAVALIGQPIRFASGASGQLTNRIVVALAQGSGASHRQALRALRQSKGFISDTTPFSPLVHLALFTTPAAALEAANALHTRPDIRYAHPDFALTLEARRDENHPREEPLYTEQWHLDRIDADRAWTKTLGRSDIIVAVIDLGFETAHPDLIEGWYINPSEVAGNRRDDDGNGLIDDVSGWNYAINGTNLIYGQNPAHGTATAGIIGARANAQGVAGLCSGCTLLPLVIDSYPSSAAAAFHYARAAGASVASNSWGYAIGTPAMSVVTDAIEQFVGLGRDGKGATVVFATGNFRSDRCRGDEPDISALEAVVAVSASDYQDQRVDPSGIGSCIDILAPSSGSTLNAILTTDRPGEKGYNRGSTDDVSDLDYTRSFYGTSAAAPQVAATFALLYSAYAELTAKEARDIVLATTDKIEPERAQYDPATGHSHTHGYGRLHTGRAMEHLSKFAAQP